MERSEVRFGLGGERCAATFYRPGGVGGRGPCVVMAHGVTLTRLDGIPDYAERFAAAGFALLPLTIGIGATARASRGAGSRSAVSSRTGVPLSRMSARWRAWIRNASRFGACRWAAGTRC